MSNDTATVKPGKMIDMVTTVPEASDMERQYTSLAAYLDFIGYDGTKLPAPSNVSNVWAIHNLVETL